MRICIINTGGTISSIGKPLAPMPAARFAETVDRSEEHTSELQSHS